MSTKYNEMLASHFRSKPILVTIFDPHRNRNVTLHYIDDDILVGCSDGIDAWVSPATSFPALDLPTKIQKKEFMTASEFPIIRRREVKKSVERRALKW